MKFDITNIDKVKLLQTLYAYADPTVGIGGAEYITRKANGENVEVLTKDDCNIAMHDFCSNPKKSGCYQIFDYYNGKPLKIVFDRLPSGRVVISANSYDERNGKYRFLEAMISTFASEDIMIIDKTTPTYVDDNDNSTKERINHFKTLLKSSVRDRNQYGYYWRIA